MIKDLCLNTRPFLSKKWLFKNVNEIKYVSKLFHYLYVSLNENRKYLNIGTDRSEQTVHIQIRLLLKEQFNQGLHCLPFHPQLFDA